MPRVDRLTSPEPREPLSFRMPLVPADYLDRSPVLTEEERTGVAKLLQLTPPRYLEFDRQVRQLSRVTQPLMDVLALFQQWRPKSRAVRQGFLTYVWYERRRIIGSSWFLVSRWENSFTSSSHVHQALDC